MCHGTAANRANAQKSLLDCRLHPGPLCFAKLELSSRPSVSCLRSSDPHLAFVFYTPFCPLWYRYCFPPQMYSCSGLFCSSAVLASTSNTFLSCKCSRIFLLSILPALSCQSCPSSLSNIIDMSSYFRLNRPQTIPQRVWIATGHTYGDGGDWDKLKGTSFSEIVA